MTIRTNKNSAFTLVEIMIVVAIIGLLAAIAIPNFVRARTTAQKNACISNLKQIQSAKEQWALENKKTQSSTPISTDLYSSTNYIKAAPLCPGGGTYAINSMANNPTCTRTNEGHALP
jgi:prepilin-type N-terminal cleavage/methylation domain-containing protein